MHEKITIAPIKLELQHPTEVGTCFIEIFEDHLRYKMDFIAEEAVDPDDPLRGWESVKTYIDARVFKDRIAGLELSVSAKGRWLVTINVPSQGIVVYFKTQFAAQQLLDKMNKWVFGVDPNV